MLKNDKIQMVICAVMLLIFAFLILTGVQRNALLDVRGFSGLNTEIAEQRSPGKEPPLKVVDDPMPPRAYRHSQSGDVDNRRESLISDPDEVSQSISTVELSRPGYLQKSHTLQSNTEFIKIGADGEKLLDHAGAAVCALDKKTGLLWEIKTFDGGVRDVESTYDLVAKDSVIDDVLSIRGECYKIYCTSDSYLEYLNDTKLCGLDNWRVPTFYEFESILDRRYYDPVINQGVFRNERGAKYWTATTLKNDPSMVMQIDFFNGSSSFVKNQIPLAIRAVSRYSHK